MLLKIKILILTGFLVFSAASSAKSQLNSESNCPDCLSRGAGTNSPLFTPFYDFIPQFQAQLCNPVRTLQGSASFYGHGKDAHFNGQKTANGEIFDTFKLTAAMKINSITLGKTIVLVTNTRNGKSVLVRVNDHGPYVKQKNRIIDLSYAAALAIDSADAGVVPVTVQICDI